MTSFWTSRPTVAQVYSVILDTEVNSGVQNYPKFVQQQNLGIKRSEKRRSDDALLTVDKLFLIPSWHCPRDSMMALTDGKSG